MGKSDQGGCCLKVDAMICISFSPSASSPTTTLAAPTSNSAATSAAVAQMWQDTTTSASAAAIRSASRPLGARISTRESVLLDRVMFIIFVFAVYLAPPLNQDIG